MREMTGQAVSQTLAMNPQNDCGLRLNGCPCGFNTHPHKECACSPATVSRYQKRISGPHLDPAWIPAYAGMTFLDGSESL
jgi:hypothetical protein